MATDELPNDVTNSAARFDSAKATKAAKHPKRPGQQCTAAPGALLPLIDRNRCEAKADCVAVCPYDVFEVRRIDADDRAKLSFFGRLKNAAHGGRTAYTIRSDACRACGLCVVACPEKAITLGRR